VPFEELPIWVALGAILFLLLVLLVVLLQVAGRLRRLESRLSEAPPPPSGRLGGKVATRARKRLFERYLAEDPERRRLPKKEQFADFRRWRARNGMNWPEGGR
jgi:hypothetical protein